MKYGITGVAMLMMVAFQARADVPRAERLQLPSGQYVTPAAMRGASQQFLNPGLPAYPELHRGRSGALATQPGRPTLAVLCAGQNSLYKPDGDRRHRPNSTQFIFLLRRQRQPQWGADAHQVLKQTNAHVGLVFSPDGRTRFTRPGQGRRGLRVRDSSDDGARGRRRGPSLSGHGGKGVGISVGPNASRSRALSRRPDAGRRQQLQRLDQRDRYGHRHRSLRARPSPLLSPETRVSSGGVGGTFPFAVVVKGKVAYVSSDRNREVVVIDISSPTAGRLVKRIKLAGNALGMTLDALGSAAVRGAGQRRPGGGHRHHG